MQHMEMEKLHQLAENVGANGEEAGEGNAAHVSSNFPDQLRRRYEVYLTLSETQKLMPMRSVTSHQLGALVKIKVRLVPERWKGLQGHAQ
jgi:hypothetical protein